MSNTSNPKGFRPHGIGHQSFPGVAGAAVKKGDALGIDSDRKFVPFVATTHGRVFGVAGEDAASGATFLVYSVDDGALYEVESALTFAGASHRFGCYDISGSTGAQKLATTEVYGHCRIVGVYPITGKPDSTGANCNVLVTFERSPTSLAGNPAIAAVQFAAAETLSADKTLTDNLRSSAYLFTASGADRNVALPTATPGKTFWFKNAGGSNAVVIKTGGTTVVSLAAGKAALVGVDTSGSWAALAF